MSKFTLRQLELFVAVVDHPTMSEAALALHFSESALSQAITKLETAVGEQLCVRRKSRGIQLTPAGTYFAQRARKLIRDADDLVAEMGGTDGKLMGPVKLGCFASFAPNVVPAILVEFAKIHPDITVDVKVGTHDELLPALEQGALDLVLVYDMELPPGLHKRTIYRTELHAVLHPDHPLAQKDEVTLEELALEPLIMYESSPSTANTLRVFAGQGLIPHVLANMPQIDLVQALAGRGLGYGLLMSRPNWVPLTVEGLPVEFRALTNKSSRTTLCGIWPTHTSLGPRAQALLDFAVETFAAGPGFVELVPS